MKKLFAVMIALLSLAVTGCSEFWEWAEAEEDRTYVYNYYAGTLSSSQYKNLFTSKWDDKVEYNGFYSKDNSNFNSTAETLKEISTKKRLACRRSDIEEQLHGFMTEYKIQRVLYKTKEEGESIWVDENSGKFIYVKLVNVR